MNEQYDEMTVRRVKRAVCEQLLAIPSVTAVGVGPKRVGGEPVGGLAIKVFVRDKRPAARVPAAELIPARIDGVRTDVEPGGDPVPLACPSPNVPGSVDDAFHQKNDNLPHDVLVGGIKITAHGIGEEGTLGCLVHEKTNPDAAYILTVMHLFGKNANAADIPSGSVKVGQPDGRDSTCGSDIVGVYTTGNGVLVGQDEAVIRLNPGTKWSPAIADIGPVKGIADAVLDGTYTVMKRGFRTGITGGVVLADDVHTKDPAGPHSTIALLIVAPNPNPDAEHGRVTFVQPGDSGSVLLNDQCQVVGLVVKRDPAGNGYAHPIALVLERLLKKRGLDLEVAVSTTDPAPMFVVPGGSTIAVPREVAARLAADPGMRATFRGSADRAPVGRPWFTDVPPRGDAIAGLRADLDASGAGRLLAALWERHRPELTGLLRQDRRLMLVWQRGGGAALVQLLLRMPSHPQQPLPRTLHGEPLMACLEKAYGEFRRCASPDLRADLERVRAFLPDLAGLTYQGIVDALATAPAEELSVHE